MKGDVECLVRSVETHPCVHLGAGYWRIQVEDRLVLGYVMRVHVELDAPFT